MVQIPDGLKAAQPTAPFPLTPPAKPSQSSSFAQDTLISMGKTVGFGLFQALRFIAARSVSWVSTFFGPETFLEPAGVTKTFEEDPFKVLNRILYLFEKYPDVCEKALINLANDWKGHPENYLPYQKDKRQIRLNWVAGLDLFLENLFLTKEQRDFNKKISEADLSAEEFCVMRDQDWKALKNPSPAAKKARELWVAIEKLRKSKDILWDGCYAYFLENWDYVSDLNPNCEDEHLEGKDQMSFGHLIERMMNKRNPRNLYADDIFNYWLAFLKTVFQYFETQQSTSPIKNPTKRIQRILADDVKVKRLRDIVSKLVPVFYPSGKTSPPRRRASVD